MLMSLERHMDDFDVEKVKKAIFNAKCFEPIHLSKYGDIYFINGGGNHRVCQAKFLVHHILILSCRSVLPSS